MLLEGKVALITGAGRGIGKAIALNFANEGALVVLSGRNESALNDVKNEIEAKGKQAVAITADLAKEDQVSKLIAETLNLHQRIDILINNAGISKEMPLVEMPMAIWDQIMEINLRAVVLCTKAVLPGMIERKCGNIVNIASAAGLRGLPGSTAYAASKAAVICLGQALGDELRPYGIRVNSICPGPVDTELFKQSERREFILQAGGDVFLPETIASGALYLASDMSKGMSSQVLVIRGFNRW
jgi:NAD(P)-dependent dehydrogenase (short-subunit alcohol dehydrogenase family)